MTMQEIEVAIAAFAPEYCRRNGIRSLRLFGSQLHGTATVDSDIDLLVELDPSKHISMLGLGRMQIELSDMLGRNVDLRTAAELSRYFREDVLRESKVLYVA